MLLITVLAVSSLVSAQIAGTDNSSSEESDYFEPEDVQLPSRMLTTAGAPVHRDPLELPTMAFDIKFQNSGLNIRRGYNESDRLRHAHAHGRSSHTHTRFEYGMDFRQITLECNSSYPKKWEFSANLKRDGKGDIGEWFIDKARYVNSGGPAVAVGISTSSSVSNQFAFLSTNYTFTTHLDIKFPEIKGTPFSYTFNCQHINTKSKNNPEFKNLSSYITLSTNGTHLAVEFGDGEMRPEGIGRYGRNKKCTLRLHLDRQNKKFGCSFASNLSSIGIKASALNCNDNDECTSLVQLGQDCAGAIVESCDGLDGDGCQNFDHRRDSGFFLCEVGDSKVNYNSIAVIHYFSLVEPKKMYLFGEKPPLVDEILTVQPLNSSADVYYLGDTLVFNCTGSASYFSQGFYWILENPDGRQEHLGSNPDPPDSKYLQHSEAYTTVRAIDFNQTEIKTWAAAGQVHAIKVYCLGPKWSSYDWENVSTYVNFTNAPRNSSEPSPEKSSSSQDGSHRILILVAIVLSFLFLLLVFFVVGVWYVKKRARETAAAFGFLSQDEINEFLHGDGGGSSGALWQGREHHAMFYPYNTDYEIERKQFQIESKVLGDGQFGQVLRGTVGKAPVAVKTVKKCADVMYLKALLSELKIMTYVGRHENIVCLIGACTENIDKREVYLLVEFCENGCLLTYLRNQRSVFVNYLTESPSPSPAESDSGHSGGSGSGRPGSNPAKQLKNRASRWLKQQSVITYQNATVRRISSRDLLRWSSEIAAGMEHLSSKNVIHGDLAARNILLTSDLTAKVGDFGLSKQLHDYSVYVQRIECPLPLRWMAVESLRDLEFSKESDVWSYGVTVWEMFSLGQLPYPAVDWDFESWKLIRDGYRMDRPDYASDEVYKVMLDCWNIVPEERPRFKDLEERFLEILRDLDTRRPCPSLSPSLYGKRPTTIRGQSHRTRF